MLAVEKKASRIETKVMATSPLFTCIPIEPCFESKATFKMAHLAKSPDLSLHHMDFQPENELMDESCPEQKEEVGFESFKSAAIVFEPGLHEKKNQVKKPKRKKSLKRSKILEGNIEKADQRQVNNLDLKDHIKSEDLYDIEEIEDYQNTIKPRKKKINELESYCLFTHFPRLAQTFPGIPQRRATFLRLRPSLGEKWIWEEGEPSAKVIADGFHDLAYFKIQERYKER